MATWDGQMRVFNQLVLDTTINGTLPVCTKVEHQDLLGRGDTLTIEVEVESASGTSPTLTLDVYHCNSGRVFVVAPSGTALINAAPLTSLPYRDIVVYDASKLAGLGQIRVTLGGTLPAARVRVWVCGRASS